MAQERTLGYASAPERSGDEPSKEELQRRMEEARESIASTVSEIKETIDQKVENVKDALDWREYFKKQPVAWSLGAMGVGFLTGYGLAAVIKGEGNESYRLSESDDYSSAQSYGYGKSSSVKQPLYSDSSSALDSNGELEDTGPGLLERFRETSAYDRLSEKAGSLGNRLLDELSTTAEMVVLPLFLAKIKNWIGIDLSDKEKEVTSRTSRSGTGQGTSKTYQPVTERSS